MTNRDKKEAGKWKRKHFIKKNGKIVFEMFEQKSWDHFKSVLIHCFTIYRNEFGEP